MKNSEIERMKQHLRSRVEEWLGNDIPIEGTEDYAKWESRNDEIEGIESINDVITYLDSEGMNPDDFFINGEYDLIKSGLAPSDISAQIILELGKELMSSGGSDELMSNVYEYCGIYFVISKGNVCNFDSKEDAIFNAKIFPTSPEIQLSNFEENLYRPEEVPTIEKVSNLVRPVLIVVSKWPDGTMAFKFGSALSSALNVSSKEMELVQKSPERIFKVQTDVAESTFRNSLQSKDVSFSGKIFFLDLQG